MYVPENCTKMYHVDVRDINLDPEVPSYPGVRVSFPPFSGTLAASSWIFESYFPTSLTLFSTSG